MYTVKKKFSETSRVKTLKRRRAQSIAKGSWASQVSRHGSMQNYSLRSNYGLFPYA